MVVNYISMIANTLIEHFPDVTIYKNKVEQGLQKPCFFISCINTEITDLRADYKRIRKLFNITYISDETDKQDIVIKLSMLNSIKDSNTELRIFNKSIKSVEDDIVMTFETLDMYRIDTEKDIMQNITQGV